jgi:hypothetical protein
MLDDDSIDAPSALDVGMGGSQILSPEHAPKQAANETAAMPAQILFDFKNIIQTFPYKLINRSVLQVGRVQ